MLISSFDGLYSAAVLQCLGLHRIRTCPARTQTQRSGATMSAQS